jgi:hypothetical protein
MKCALGFDFVGTLVGDHADRQKGSKASAMWKMLQETREKSGMGQKINERNLLLRPLFSRNDGAGLRCHHQS